MFRSLALLLLTVFFPTTALGSSLTFPYKDWTSADGKVIHARLTKLADKQVTLQVKKGGKRYTFERSKLSQDSNQAIDKIRRELEATIKAGTIDATTIYRGTSVGLVSQLSAALRYKRLNFSVTEVRVESNRVSAFVGLEDGLFVQLSAARGYEFYEQKDALFTRPSNKTRIDTQRSTNKRSRRIATTDAQYTVTFGKIPTLNFGVVGVSDGVIIHP